MAANYSNTYILNADVGHICSVLRDVRFYGFLQLKFMFETYVQGGMMYQFSNGFNLASWGENINITVLYFNESSSYVIIKSECVFPTQIIDWGKNKSNVDKIYNHLMVCMAYNLNFNYVPYQPVNDQNFGSQQFQQAPIFCRACGTQLTLESSFCHKCGTQVT